MPFNLSFTHIMVVAVVALIVLGPERLPGVARQAGNFYREWKRISSGIEAEVRDVIADFTEPLQEPIQQIRETMTGIPSTVSPPGTVSSPGTAPAAHRAAVGPLAAGLPTLGPSTGLMTPGPPTSRPELPTLGPPPDPDTVVPGPPELAVRSLATEPGPS